MPADISFPSGFVALKKYPGYFWHTEKKILFTMKVDGVLKPMTLQKVSKYQSYKVFDAWPGQTYEEYKEAVFSNKDAMLVKMADLRHNSDIRRLKGVTQKDIERMAKYNQFYLEIKARLI